MKFFILLLVAACVAPQTVFAAEILAVPEDDSVGPNDWIKIFLKIDGYSGGPITWNVTKPDGTSEFGSFENIQASKVTHTINRNAFDHQFGVWQVNYQYRDTAKSIDVNVEPLALSVTTDKPSYFSGEKIAVQFTTNYFELNAAKAQSLSMNLVDSNGKNALLSDEIRIKVSQPNIAQIFPVDDLLKYNSYGTYHVVVKYFGIEVDVPFEVLNPNSKNSIFLGNDKALYDPGDAVEINIILSQLTADSGLLTVTYPSGKILTKTVPISASLTRVTLDDLTSSEIGTFVYEFQYGNNRASKTFDVLSETLDKPKVDDLEIDLILDKSQYRPGEAINIKVIPSKLIQNQVVYWFEDSSGKQSTEFFFTPPFFGEFTIPHTIPSDFEAGPWKVHVQYGTIVSSALFNIFGEPIPSESALVIPDWIRNNAKWWSENKISDDDFTNGIEYMIKENIITIPTLGQGEPLPKSPIPYWIKNSAKWWSDGLVSDQEFANSIEYLVNAGIIRV